MASHIPTNQELIAKYGGGPYPSKSAALGFPPTVIPDVPITSVFLVLFFLLAVGNMTLFRGNSSHGHFFVFSGAMFGFSFIRFISAILRLALVYHLDNPALAIAAQIFVAAGTVIMFIINFFFSQRIIRARHPHFGWHNPIGRYFPMVGVFFVLSSLFILITAVIQLYYTLDPDILAIDKDLMLYGSTMFAVLAFLPIPIILTSLAFPRKVEHDKFGAGSFKAKVALVLTCSAFLTLGAAYRCGTSYLPFTPSGEYRWYYSKAAFYLFDYSIDFGCLFAYFVFRVDRQFHVPNKEHGRGHGTYSIDRDYYKKTGVWPGGNPVALSPPHNYTSKDPEAQAESITNNEKVDSET